MKKILILTDFSENSACAAEAGLTLSGKLHIDLLLFNTYIDYATLPYESGGVWDCNEFSRRKQHSIQGLESLAEGLESLTWQLEPADRKPTIEFQSANCSLSIEVADLIKQQAIEMVVMGARSRFPGDTLPGADTTAVIKYANRPVLVMPAQSDLKKISNIFFASDFDEHDLSAIRYLMKLGKLMNWQLDIIHVNKPGQDTITAKELDFKERVKELGYQRLTYRKVTGDDMVAQFHELVGKDGHAMLALRHHHHSFFYRLLYPSITKATLAQQNAPLLIFPERISED